MLFTLLIMHEDQTAQLHFRRVNKPRPLSFLSFNNSLFHFAFPSVPIPGLVNPSRRPKLCTALQKASLTSSLYNVIIFHLPEVPQIPHVMITLPLKHIYFFDPSELSFMNRGRFNGFCSKLPGLLTNQTGLSIPVRWHCCVFKSSQECQALKALIILH